MEVSKPIQPLVGATEVRPSPGKGLGVFAKMHLPRGSRLFSEPPLLKITQKDHNALGAIGIYSQFTHISDTAQTEYLTLHAAASSTVAFPALVRSTFPDYLQDRIAQVSAIFGTNSYEIDAGNAIGVFSGISRINHECNPNVNQSWNARLGHLTVHAIRDIHAGEELTIPYVLPTLDIQQRRTALLRYGFICSCSACSVPSPSQIEAFEAAVAGSRQSDVLDFSGPETTRRRLIQELDQSLRFFVLRNSLASTPTQGPLSQNLYDAQDSERALDAIQELASLMIAEGLVGHELLTWYEYATRYALAQDPVDWEETLEWAKLGLKVGLYVKGSDHEDVMRDEKLVALLQAQVQGEDGVERKRSPRFDVRSNSYGLISEAV